MASLAVCLILSASPTSAGTYVWQTTNPDGTVTQSPTITGGTFTYNGFDGTPYVSNYYGTASSYGNHVDEAPFNCKCSGTIYTTYTWQPNSGQDMVSDPPPASVVVKETGYAHAHGYTGSSPVPGMCDTGLGNSVSTLGAGDVALTTTHYKVMPGGPTVSLSCSPMASCPVMFPQVDAGYSSAIYPVIVGLGGTTLDSLHNSNILVGQNCTPYLNIPGLPTGITVGWPTWSVSGDTYTSFDIGSGQSTGWAVPFPDPSANLSLNPPPANPTFFWKDANIYGFPETVQGSAVLYNTPLGALYNPNLPPSAQIGTVTASKKVQVQRPDVYSTPPTVGPHGVLEPTVNPMLGTVGIDTAHSEVVSNGPSGNGSGYYLQIAVATPNLFVQGGTNFGNWGWLQLCQLDVTQGGNGTPMATPELDSSFPYNNAGSVANGVPGSTYDAQLSNNGNPAYDGFDDSPTEQYYDYFLRYDTAFSFDNNFHLYVMYEPPDAGNGVNYVPVDMYNWEFTASMTRSGLSGIWTPNPPGSVKDLGSAPYPQYPTWTSKYSP